MILVTGKYGFIGRHVAGQALTVDIRHVEPDDLLGVDLVVHLAALKDAQEAERDPMRYWDVNVVGTYRLAEAMMQAGVEQMVFASSAAVYGDGVYGQTKRACEDLLRSLHLRVAILRIFNVVGPGCGGLFGAIRTGKVTISGDGKQVRDFVDVYDVARAIQYSVDYLYNGGETFTADIGTGWGTTVLKAAEGCEIEFGPPRAGDIDWSVANPLQAEKILGFRCESRRLPR